ncbi:MAG: nucleotide exchange factor GrpE [Candidatus Woesearchaeota archaeon]|nr:nucleotide exchange factor GrpE [Candidatus Woesearchaeota archaeon]
MIEKSENKNKEKELKDNLDFNKHLSEKDSKIKELTELLQRLQADFENYKKRAEKEKCDLAGYTACKLVSQFLPILDSFELALKNDQDHQKFVKGVELIYSQFYSLMEDFGLTPIETVGKKFDPYEHEALLSEKSDKDEDIILEELQKGYKLGDVVIRHSKVKVSKK